VNAGIDAWQKAQYADAVAIWRPLAEKGNPDAEFNLGQAYRLGRGVPTDLSTAKSWLEKAANQGHIDAETTLGLLLFQNGEQAAAIKWLRQAAEQGEPRAMLIYGTALFNGDSVTQDSILGYAYISRANAQGLPAAEDILNQLNRLMSESDRKKALGLAKQQDAAAARKVFQPGAAELASSDHPPATRTAKAAKTAKAVAAKAPKPEPTLAEKSATTPKPAAKAVASVGPATGSWSIQLGAFAQRDQAEAAYRKVSGSSVLTGRSPSYIPFQHFIRLRVGPFTSRAAAGAACVSLRKACFAVAPGK
jgi:hypothetical protein